MEENKVLIDFGNIKSVVEFLKMPSLKIAECLTGLLASDASELKLSTGRLVQASIKHKLLTQLGEEIKKYREKGQIKEDYFATYKEQASLLELLKFIDEDIPDEERFKAMKSIFLYSITNDISSEDKELSYELLKICKKINSGELLVLKVCYDIVNKKPATIIYKNIEDYHNVSEWLSIISKQLGHNLSSLVEIYENNLTELKLITDRIYPDRSGFGKSKYFRLTTLGLKLCEFITRYP